MAIEGDVDAAKQTDGVAGGIIGSARRQAEGRRGVRRCGSRPALPKCQVSGPVITPGRGRWAASVDLRAGSQELITVHDRVVHRSVGAPCTIAITRRRSRRWCKP